MTVYNFYLFDSFGTLLYYAEWHRLKHFGMPHEEVYVEYIAKNPLINPREAIKSDLFKNVLDAHVKESSIFSKL